VSFLAHMGPDGKPRLGGIPPRPRFPWVRVALLLGLLAVIACCTGCTKEEREAQVATHRYRKVREEPTATGGKVTLEEEWTDTEEHSSKTTGLDDQWAQVAQAGGGAVAAAASGDYAGAAVKGIAALSLVAAAWNARGSKAANQLADAANQRADEHKADATEGWAKFEQAVGKSS
jgi:hypothetical protein